jgi:hypothetical protein
MCGAQKIIAGYEDLGKPSPGGMGNSLKGERILGSIHFRIDPAPAEDWVSRIRLKVLAVRFGF